MTYANVLDATKALEHWNGRVVAGSALKVSVSSVSTGVGAPATAAAAALAMPALAGGLTGAAGLPLAGATGAVGFSLPADLANRFGLAVPGAGGVPGLAVPGVAATAAAAEQAYNSGIGELLHPKSSSLSYVA